MSVYPFIIIIDLSVRNILKLLSKDKYINRVYAVLIPLFLLAIKFLDVGEKNPLTEVVSTNISWISLLTLSLLSTMMFQVKSFRNEIKILIAILLIISNSFFSSLLILTTYLIWEVKQKAPDRIIYLSLLIISLLFSYTTQLGAYTQIIPILLILIGITRLPFKSENAIETSVLFSISASALILNSEPLGSLVYLTIIPLSMIFKNLIKAFIKQKINNLSISLSLLFILSIFCTLLGLRELFLLNIVFLLLVALVYKSSFVEMKNVVWPVAFLLFVLSPPFGLGYIIKIELIEKVITGNIHWAIVFAPFYLTVQILFINYSFVVIKSEFEKIKNKEISYDKLGLVVIVLNILLSLLFIPKSWSALYGDFFNQSIANNSLEATSGVGYYLFWIELLIVAIVFGVHHKLDKRYFNKLLYKLNLEREIARPYSSTTSQRFINSRKERNILAVFDGISVNYLETLVPFIILTIFILILLSVL